MLFAETKILKIISILCLPGVLFWFAPDVIAQEAWEIRPIIFPVIGHVTYWDDFGAPRDAGRRSHLGNDLMGRKMLPLVAAVDGRVRVSYPEATWGYSITITDKDGYRYGYYHVNNDMPGTDNGKGGGINAYAVDVDDGANVVAGQLIGWMGDSGNAEPTQAHLHFEIQRPDDTHISPYGSLRAAQKITKPVARLTQIGEILPYGEFMGGSFIAAGNVDADLETEIAVGAGPTGGPHVLVLKQSGLPIASIFPYAKTYKGGVDVALGDVNGDKITDIITAPAGNNVPLVKVYDIAGNELASFMAYDQRFRGGVNITTVDIDGDGIYEIITAPGKGGGPHIRVFTMNGTEVTSFFAYDQKFRSGVDVSAYTLDNQTYIATAPNTGGGPHIKVFDKTGTMLTEFLAYDAAHLGGVRVAIADIDKNNSTPEIITAPLLGGSFVRSFDFQGNALESDWPFEEWWSGSWDITADKDEVFITTGPNTKRRTSIRKVDL